MIPLPLLLVLDLFESKVYLPETIMDILEHLAHVQEGALRNGTSVETPAKAIIHIFRTVQPMNVALRHDRIGVVTRRTGDTVMIEGKRLTQHTDFETPRDTQVEVPIAQNR
jgi:hypothetical protein